ncbi:MAG TPA: hypothetical protein VGM29_11295 [Polyangiaceae bacterium]
MHRSSVTRAARGPLAAAVLSGGRIDLGHPAVQAWLAREPAGAERFVTFEQFAAMAGISVDELELERHRFEAAIEPVYDLDHPAVQALLAGQGVTA